MELPRRPTVLVLPVVLAAVLAACGSSGGTGADPERPSSSTSEPASVPTSETTLGPVPGPTSSETSVPDPAPPTEQALVELQTSGGIDGRGTGDIVVSGSGALRYVGRDGQADDGTLTPDELDDLAGLLEQTDFGAIPPPDDDEICADGVLYTVIYRQWQVGADDCSVPTEIEPVLDRLRELMARFG